MHAICKANILWLLLSFFFSTVTVMRTQWRSLTFCFHFPSLIPFLYSRHLLPYSPSTPDCPSKVPMWRGCLVAYAFVAWCYFSVAISGYYAFGNSVSGNVLQSVGKPLWVVAMANFMVFIHVLGSYQVSDAHRWSWEFVVLCPHILLLSMLSFQLSWLSSLKTDLWERTWSVWWYQVVVLFRHGTCGGEGFYIFGFVNK